MSEYTPGPWKITRQQGCSPDECLVGIVGPSQKNSLGHEYTLYVAQYMTHGNAQLIARAPELAARLTELEVEVKALEAACDREREQRKSVVRVNEWQLKHIADLEALLRECDGELSLDLDSDHPLRERIRKALEKE